MSNWERYENVEITDVYKKMQLFDSYLLKLRIPKKDSLFGDSYELEIQDTKFIEQLIELKEGERERCYFSFGMQDINLYKANNQYAMTHSPHEGLNIQLVFAANQFDELLTTLNVYRKHQALATEK
jgi:hypothetical protein